MKILKARKLSASDEDKNTIRLLRQQIYLTDQMKTLNTITDEEYNETLKKLAKIVSMLEAKYGL